jgi:hypothetical protein
MYAATKERFSDRKLKKATDANYVRHRESSIKTITRKNFGPGTHLAYSAAGKKSKSLWLSASLIVLRDGSIARK